jgi:hypothetical protein
VLGEHFGIGTGLGFALVLAGSFLATRPLRATAISGPPGEEPTALPVVAEP